MKRPAMRRIFSLLVLFCLTAAIGVFATGDAAKTPEPAISLPVVLSFEEYEMPAETEPRESLRPRMVNIKTLEVSGDLLYLHERIVEIYRKNEARDMAFAQIVNHASSTMNRKIYTCLLPTAYEFVREWALSVDLPRDSQLDAKNRIDSLLLPQIVRVNAYDKIKSKYSDDLYFRSDTRPSAQAAYIAYQAFAQSAGFEPVSISSYNQVSISYYGNLYQQLPILGINENPDNFTFYKTSEKLMYNAFLYDENGGGAWYKVPLINEKYILGTDIHKELYKVFMSGDAAIGLIETATGSRSSILVVSSSTDNAFVQFLVPHYKNVFVCDPTIYKYNLEEFVKEQRIEEVLFINTIPEASNEAYLNSLAQRTGADVSELLAVAKK